MAHWRYPPLGDRVAAVLVGLSACAVLVATSEMLPITWDEGNAIHRAQGIAAWFNRLSSSDPGQPGALTGDAIAHDWRYVNQVEGHPAFYGIVIAFGHRPSSGWFRPLTSYRLGPIILVSLAVAALFHRLRRDHGLVAGLVGIGALMTMPRVFAHAHLASPDGPLTSCWLLCWAAFAPWRQRWYQGALWGVMLGLAMSCKFTGWLAIYPFLAWFAAYGDRRAVAYLALGLAAAAFTFFVVNPPLWFDPISGMRRFFELNLNRGEHGLNVPTWFLGQKYDLNHPLPWFNTAFWTAVTVPPGTLLVAAIGLVACVRAPSLAGAGSGFLLVAHWLILLVARATPWAPPHDAERLILPSFAFLAAFAGVGGAAAIVWATMRFAQFGRRDAAGALVALLLGSASSTVWYSPQWLSYYNVFIGGLPGAAACGMEPTYYWDALDHEVLEWLHANTLPGQAVAIGSSSVENLELMAERGTWPWGIHYSPSGECRWYVVQRRPSFYSAVDRRLFADEHPAYSKTIRPADWGFGPWRLDVPLLKIYPAAQYDRAAKATGR